jgi:hypothetical protein
VQIISVERSDEPATEESRSAEIIGYDYTTDEAVHMTVNLDGTPAVDASVRTAGVQPVLNAAERKWVLDTVLSDEIIAERVRAQLTSMGFTDVSDLRRHVIADAIVLRASEYGGTLTGALASCGQHRCAQVLLRTADSRLIPVVPTVDLSTGTVLGRGRFVGDPS